VSAKVTLDGFEVGEDEARIELCEVGLEGDEGRGSKCAVTAAAEIVEPGFSEHLLFGREAIFHLLAHNLRELPVGQFTQQMQQFPMLLHLLCPHETADGMLGHREEVMS
jgi:hypothetical protein